jgi:hypothetical protein
VLASEISVPNFAVTYCPRCLKTVVDGDRRKTTPRLKELLWLQVSRKALNFSFDKKVLKYKALLHMIARAAPNCTHARNHHLKIESANCISFALCVWLLASLQVQTELASRILRIRRDDTS